LKLPAEEKDGLRSSPRMVEGRMERAEESVKDEFGD
jgi:hypothetical protein